MTYRVTCATPMSPVTPFELQSALPNRVLVRDLCEALSPTLFELSCGSILLCALKPLAARALTSQASQLGSPLASLRRPRLYILTFCCI
ncbi:MAG TPA: hypothetical protein VLG49_01125 [Rhabdochlamydiaceae bacterium]|nr:hypothetical protein [Rhabdochlamydiaceae bacterium]